MSFNATKIKRLQIDSFAVKLKEIFELCHKFYLILLHYNSVKNILTKIIKCTVNFLMIF